jgi:hypothetical protein
MPTNNRYQILLITRKSLPTASTHSTSRVIDNIDDVVAALTQYIQTMTARATGEIGPATLVVRDLVEWPFEEQIRLIGNSSVVIGMHGAGIASTIHMAVGTRYCCGVIEMFPEIGFGQIKGYGNTARRFGHIYERLDITASNATSTSSLLPSRGTVVPVSDVIEAVSKVLNRIESSGGSCLASEVAQRPYL